MATRDAYCFINDLDASTVEGLIARLEFRGKDPTFTQMRDAYLARLALPPTAHILELGCGTGVVLRALAQRRDFSGIWSGWTKVLHSLQPLVAWRQKKAWISALSSR